MLEFFFWLFTISAAGAIVSLLTRDFPGKSDLIGTYLLILVCLTLSALAWAALNSWEF